MTYKDFQDSVIATRFDESDRAEIKRWLDLRYQWIWSAADWNFRRVAMSTLAVAGGSRTPAMPSDFSRPNRLYDDLGCRLDYLAPAKWEERFLGDTSSVRPVAYTVSDRQLYLGPTPDKDYSFSLSYDRRLSHVDPSLGVIGGTMQDDGDQPLWPAEHDYLLVVDTVILGQQMRQDPTWQTLIRQRDELLEGMKRDLVGGPSEEIIVQGSPT